MRIICPDCDAQYEVPDDVIPDEGRDVQCSNCGTTWFFDHGERSGSSQTDTVARDAATENVEEAEGALAVPASRRELDPQVADILRAEAQREAAARARDVEPGPLEVQTELGLTDGPAKPLPVATSADTGTSDRPDATAGRVAVPGNMTVASAMAERNSRRDRLPDIEEINSSLRSGGEPDEVSDHAGRTEHGRMGRRRGFRSGLVFAILVFALGLLAYQFAPEIAKAVPETDPWLSGYVTWVEEMRVELDATLRRLLEWLDAQTATLTE